MDVSNYGGSYLKASDAQAETHVRIEAVDADTDYNGKPCLVLTLNGDKKWQLKPRDVNAIKALFGKDSDGWIGKPITLTVDQGEYQDTPYDFFVVNPYVKKEAVGQPAVAPAAKEVDAPPTADFTEEDSDLPF